MANRTLIFGFLTAVSLPIPALAADIDAQSRIDTVRLYADRAEITRIVEFEAPTGGHRLIVSDLPGAILPQSLTITPGTASIDVQLGQVALVTRPLPGRSDEAAQALLDQIEALERKRGLEHDKIAAEEASLSLIKGLAHGLENDEAARMRRGALKPQELQELIALVRDESRKALAEITQARFQIDDIGKAIDLLKRQLDELDNGATAERVAVINLQAGGAVNGQLALSYQIRGGAWHSSVDAKLDTVTGDLMLTQFAVVNQRTGEDWENVRLEFSTARPIASGLPDFEPWVIDVVENRYDSPEPAALESMALDVQTRGGAQEKLAATRSRSMTQGEAVIEVQGLDARYVAQGRADVPSGGSQHRILIGAFAQTAVLTRKAIPSLRSEALLNARFEFHGPAPLRASEIRLFRDGGFAGSLQAGMMVPGDVTELEFGRDDRIEISRRLDNDGRSSEGILTDYRRVTRNYETIVTNHNEQSVEVTIVDRHPVPRDERIEVETAGGNTRPSRRDLDGKNGVMAWDLALAPGEREIIRFGYSVIYPSDLEITHF